MSDDLAWQDAYSVGNADIDAEHRTLFEIAGEILAISDPHAERDTVRRDVHRLYHYMRTHFENEERYMAEVGYPGLDQQRREHAAIAGHVTGLLKRSHDSLVLVEGLKAFMGEWLLNHIIKKDGQIMDFVLSQEDEGGEGETGDEAA